MNKYFLIFIKGLLMGSADIIPGVSGGTIAFITGIYDELLDSINKIKPSLLKDIKIKKIIAIWQEINGGFLLALVLGIFTAVLSLAKLIGYLLQYHPIELWSFFFGLILASSIYTSKEIQKWDALHILNLVTGVLFMVFISSIPPLSPNESLLFLFFAGSLSICAMILPGISGSFILVVLGVYSYVLSLISNLIDSLPLITFHEILPLLILISGMTFGLFSFSRFLKMLLDKSRTKVIALLTGLMLGSLWKLWPWKVTPWIFDKSKGKIPMADLNENLSSLSVYLKYADIDEFKVLKPYLEQNVLPQTYSVLNNHELPNIQSALILLVLGLCILFLIERIASQKT